MELEYPTTMEEYVTNAFQVQTHSRQAHEDPDIFIDYNSAEAYDHHYGADMTNFYGGKDPESQPIHSSPSPSSDDMKSVTDPGLVAFEQAYYYGEQENTNFDIDMDAITLNMQVETMKPTDRKKKIFKILHDTVSTADSDCMSQSTSQHSQIQINVKRGRKSKKCYVESPVDSEVFSFEEEELHKKSKQNPRRNGPGLIIKRARTGLVLLFDQHKQPLDGEEQERLEYMNQVVRQFISTQDQLAGFERFIRGFNLQAKTWNNILANLSKNIEYGRIFLKVTDAFLSKEGEKDFEDWLENGKLKSGKAAIRESKGWFKREFNERFASIAC